MHHLEFPVRGTTFGHRLDVISLKRVTSGTWSTTDGAAATEAVFISSNLGQRYPTPTLIPRSITALGSSAGIPPAVTPTVATDAALADDVGTTILRAGEAPGHQRWRLMSRRNRRASRQMRSLLGRGEGWADGSQHPCGMHGRPSASTVTA